MISSFKPKLANEYSDKEKIQLFDALHDEALKLFNHVNKHGSFKEDYKQYMWQAQMELLAKSKKEFWNVFNAILEIEAIKIEWK